jgi:hypothetical protein
VTLVHPSVCWRWLARIVLWLSLLVSGVSVFAQATSFIILTNGPSANRLNIVVLSEGYRTNELATFRADATNIVNAILSVPPFDNYRGYFNASGIAVASAESGSDHPSTGIKRDTYFNSTFESYGTPQLLTLPPNNFNTYASNGTAKVTALLNQFMPEWDLVVILVNDTVYGGSGGSYLTVSKHASAAEIARHELGHTLARLGDEYDTPYPGYPTVEEPNTTRETNRANLKWKVWMQSSTPVPTPATSAYGSVIGLFEGAHYNYTGWYRPKLNCRMRALNTDYCEVCKEALVKSTYSRLKPVADFQPAGTNVTLGAETVAAFAVNPLIPGSTRSLQWSLNGAVLTNVTSTNLALQVSQLATGTNFIRCIVRDTTAMVRNDPSNNLRGVVEWRVVLDGPRLRMEPPRWLGAGKLAMKVSGYAPKGFILQASEDFQTWTDVSTQGGLNGTTEFTNAVPVGINALGFRAVAAP